MNFKSNKILHCKWFSFFK